MGRTRGYPWLITLAAIVATIAGGCQPNTAEVVTGGRTMGTAWTVRVSRCPLRQCEQVLQRLTTARLQTLTKVFSHYDPESELSRFNRHPGNDWFAVSAELAEVAKLAGAISRLSGGAFDITVAPAVDAWGFGPADAPGKTPAPESLDTLRTAIDYRALEVRLSPPALRRRKPGLRIDMSGIAKGYAVDQIAYLLESKGIDNYLVDIGGEIRTAGLRADGQPWRIGIERPAADTLAAPEIQFVVTPGNEAVASSGDYRNNYVLDGERISHTINPVTASPVHNHLAGVSVIAPAAAQADALATALMVLGPERGRELAEREQLAALFTVREGNRLRSFYTRPFTRYLLRD